MRLSLCMVHIMLIRCRRKTNLSPCLACTMRGLQCSQHLQSAATTSISPRISLSFFQLRAIRTDRTGQDRTRQDWSCVCCTTFLLFYAFAVVFTATDVLTLWSNPSHSLNNSSVVLPKRNTATLMCEHPALYMHHNLQ